MDSNQPITPELQPSQPTVQNPQKKTNLTGIIIFLLVIVATIITATVYFLLPEKKQGQSTTTTTTTTTSPTGKLPINDVIQWITYTDKIHQYSFNYPEVWTLTNNKANPSQFSLSYTGSEPGEIQGEFLSQEQFSKKDLQNCKGLKDPKDLCLIYQKTAKSSAYLYPVLENNKPTSSTAYVTRPNGEGFTLHITKPNASSYNTFIIILETLRFPNEKQNFPFLLCPDSWSVAQKTVTFHNFTFPVEKVDEAWIHQHCT